jgi:tetratricopeptide (TPR) repeat protein
MSVRLSLVIIVICLAIAFPLQKSLDEVRPLESSVEDVLYLPSGNIVKTVSFGFDGILADIYWLRSVQYFGRQLLDENNEIDWSRSSKIRLDLLYPLLDITTTLDPHYIAPYRFGAVFLPDYNYELALKLVKKGIEHNPTNWRLYQNLGILYWKAKDYKSASDVFFKGSEQPKSPIWMKILGGVMLSQGGSRETACKMYASLLQEAIDSNDDFVRGQMESKLQWISALDEVDYMNNLISAYREATGRCPTSLIDLAPTLRRPSGLKGSCGQPINIKLNGKGEPVSPIGMLYKFDSEACQAKMPFEYGEF